MAVRLKAALAVLHSMGTLQPEPIGKIDPEAIESDLSDDSIRILPLFSLGR